MTLLNCFLTFDWWKRFSTFVCFKILTKRQTKYRRKFLLSFYWKSKGRQQQKEAKKLIN